MLIQQGGRDMSQRRLAYFCGWTQYIERKPARAVSGEEKWHVLPWKIVWTV